MDNNNKYNKNDKKIIAFSVATLAGMAITAGGIFAYSLASTAVGLPIMIAGAGVVAASTGAALVIAVARNWGNNKVAPQENEVTIERGEEREMAQTHANSRSRPVTPTSAQNVGGTGHRSISDNSSSSEYSTTSTEGRSQ